MEVWQYITHNGEKENPFVSVCCSRCVQIQKQWCLVIAVIFILCSENSLSGIVGRWSELGVRPPPTMDQEQLHL